MGFTKNGNFGLGQFSLSFAYSEKWKCLPQLAPKDQNDAETASVTSNRHRQIVVSSHLLSLQLTPTPKESIRFTFTLRGGGGEFRGGMGRPTSRKKGAKHSSFLS